MKRITENSKLAIKGSWAAWNHALAVELEKREAKLLPPFSNLDTLPHWFSPELDIRVINILLDPQVEIKKSIESVFRIPWKGCQFAAWRYLHDIVEGALPANADSAQVSRQARMLDEVYDKWLILVDHWNAQPQKIKEEINGYYKTLLDKIISKDFSPLDIREEEQAGLQGLNVQVCDAIIIAFQEHLGKLQPVHLHVMLKVLERFDFAPKRKRAACAVFLGGKYGVKVRRSYRPDPSRHRLAEYDHEEAYSDHSKAKEITFETLVGLNLIPKDYAFKKRSIY